MNRCKVVDAQAQRFQIFAQSCRVHAGSGAFLNHLGPVDGGDTGLLQYLLNGIAAGLDWPLTGQLASLLGAIKIAQRGGQNHQFTRSEIAARFKENFGTAIW